MTAEERKQLVEELEETKAALLESTEGLTEEQWRFKPSTEEWSVAECLEHITIVENRLVSRVRDLAAGPPSPEEVLAQAAGKEDVIRKLVPSRRGKVKAPPEASPTNRWADAAARRANFSDTRDRTIAYVKTTDDPVASCTFAHFVFGPLNGYQWMIFVAAHSERHRKQLNEVKLHAAFPAR
jgi:hypothetical protein